MRDSSTKTDSLATILSAALATGLAGGALHMAASLGPAPRALSSFGSLLGPTAAAIGAVACVALVVCAALPRLGARICEACAAPSVLRAALGTVLVVGAALWPLSVGDEPTTGALVSWSATALLAGAAVFGLGQGAGPRSRALLLLGAPLASLLLLAASWARTYSSAGLGLALAALALGVFVLAWRVFERVPALPVLFALAGAIAAAGAGGLLRGDGDLRNHRARAFDGGRPSPIVLITVDTLRPDFLSRAREDGAETPTLDALFADSVVFTQARSSAPWTKPSVATILTGLSPLVHGTTTRNVRLPEEAHTLAEHMADAGFVTAGMGLNVHLEPFFGFAQGFDQYWFPVRKEWGDSMGSALLRRADPKRFPALLPTTEALADVAVAWLDDNKDRDFFLWIHFLDPHWPYEPPQEHLPEPEPGQRIGSRWGEHETVAAVQAGTRKLGKADQAQVRALYRGEIEYVDAELARVIAKLRELGLYDDALIAFTSDHGEEFWEHGRFEHGHTLYDEVLRVPMAFKLPGATQVARYDARVSNEALAATLLELADIEPAHDLTADSLVPFWSDAPVEPLLGLAAGTYYYDEQRMILSGDHKLIVDFATGRTELYDLGQDPEERFALGARDKLVGPLLELMREREAELAQLQEKLAISLETVSGDAALQRLMDNLGYQGNDDETGGQ